MSINLFKYYLFISVEFLIYGWDAIAIRLSARVYQLKFLNQLLDSLI